MYSAVVLMPLLGASLAGLILEGTLADGETVHISAGRDGLTINGRMAEAA